MQYQYIDEKDVFEKVVETICELYPEKKPRMELEDEYIPTKNTALKIDFCFFKDKDGIVRSQMYFTKDYNGMSKFYLINDKLSNETVGKIMSFIFYGFPYVNSVQTSSIGFDIESVIGLEQFKNKGISCSRINIVFSSSIKFANEFSDMFQGYLNYILSNYIEYMRRAPQIKEIYKKYRASVKKNIINSLTRDKLEEFISLLSDEELRELLIGMNSDNFFDICKKLDKNIDIPKSLKLVKGIPNRIISK